MLTASGLTSVHDAMVSNDELYTYAEGRDSGDLSLRVYMLAARPHFPALRDAGLRSGFGDDRLRLGGIKMVSDGAIAARTAYMSEPYIGTCDHGIEAMTQEEITESVLEIHKAGFQVGIHANGDLAIESVLNAYEQAQREHPRPDPRHRIEHCTLVNPGLLSRMNELGTIATPFCTYVYYHVRRWPSTAKRGLSGCSRSVRLLTAEWSLPARPTIRPARSSRSWESRAVLLERT